MNTNARFVPLICFNKQDSLKLRLICARAQTLYFLVNKICRFYKRGG